MFAPAVFRVTRILIHSLALKPGLVACLWVALYAVPPEAVAGEGMAHSSRKLTCANRSCPPDMVFIAGGEFDMGGNGSHARKDEFPVHRVRVDGFFMDKTEVTNAQFERFVEATGYITTAEKKPDWQELKKQLPPGSAVPERDFKPGSLVFVATKGPVKLNDVSNWWKWIDGADWRHPEGPLSSIHGKENHPVVQVSWDDANAYCKWAGKRLPTEAEWEYAARGGRTGEEFSWAKKTSQSRFPANLWQGRFPYENKGLDKFITTAPVKSFAANDYGLYDMIGNVWEWCADWYRSDYYETLAGKLTANPQGPESSYDPSEPRIAKRVKRGGSFLCCDEYCFSYRPAARMKNSPDSAQNHLGFRAVVSAPYPVKAEPEKKSTN